MPARALESHRSNAIALTIGAIGTVLFAALTVLVLAHRTDALDRELIVSLRQDATPFLTTFLLAVTFTSGKLGIPFVILFAALLYRQGGARAAAFYVGACASAELIDAILKYATHRVRPHGVSPLLTRAGGYSYPSADAMLAVVIFGLGVLLLTWPIRSAALRAFAILAAALFVIAAAIARVYLGAHWPTDVIGGELAGTACAAFWLRALWRAPAAARLPSAEMPSAAR